MIPIEPQPEPATFCRDVRRKGLRALACQLGLDPPFDLPGRRPERIVTEARAAALRAMPPETLAARLPDMLREIPSGKLKPYWTDCLDDLHHAYDGICAYLGVYLWKGSGLPTVDHYVPRNHDRLLAYEWSNFRLSAHLVNSRKSDEAHLDPFELGADWFHLNLGGGEVFANPEIEASQPELFQQIDSTITTLHLNESPFPGDRLTYVSWCEDPSKRGVVPEMAPFVYREAVRQRFIEPFAPSPRGPGPFPRAGRLVHHRAPRSGDSHDRARDHRRRRPRRV